MNTVFKQQKNDKKSKITFYEFIRLVFYTLSPDQDFFDNWHIEYLSNVLEAIRIGKYKGGGKRLIINLPPRSMKSTIITVAWPAWVLGHTPGKRIIAASYSQHLSNKLSNDCRAVIQSEWYREIFPDTIIERGNNAKSKFVTTEQGFRFATSVGGALTGEGADIIVVDDPMTPMQAISQAKREMVTNWFDQTLVSRLNNKKEGVIVVVMQRLHKKDLTSHLMYKNNWQNISIPSIAEDDTFYEINDYKHWRRAGTVLHMGRDNIADLEKLRQEIGSRAFNAQYQQTPIAATSQILRFSWIKRYDMNQELPEGEIYQSWDCSFKISDDSDYSVCTTWLVSKSGIYLLDVMRERLIFPDLKKAVLELAERFQPNAIIIEDKAAGQSLIQQLQQDTRLPIIGYIPKGDKFSRMVAVTPFFESGNVYMPSNAHWLAAFELELMNFPHVKHDDQVDSTSQLLNWLRKRSAARVNIRVI